MRNWGAAHYATGQQTFGRTYTYDSLNRLSAMSSPSDPSGCYGLSWTIDSWGNRNVQAATGGSCNTFSQTADSNNHLPVPYQYDAAGNMIHDASHSYSYDAENRIVSVDGGSTAKYVYDALGNRVERTNSSGTFDEFFDFSGHRTAEWENIPVYNGWANDWIYLGNNLLAQYDSDTTRFMHQDHLGSTRLVTGLNGNVLDSLDFLPFGEQIEGGQWPHEFTGKQRDFESDLDQFGARYYSSSVGRFMTPDWAAKPTAVPYANFGNPQSLNLYSYVENNPTTTGDPDGHTDAPSPFICFTCIQAAIEVVSNPRQALKDAGAAVVAFAQNTINLLPGGDNHPSPGVSVPPDYVAPPNSAVGKLTYTMAAVGTAAMAGPTAASDAGPSLLGFSDAEAGMIGQSLKNLSGAGYDVTPFQQLVKADLPASTLGMSLSTSPTGAALSSAAFSSQQTLDSTMEEELLHLNQNLPSQTFGPGTAQQLEQQVNGARQFGEEPPPQPTKYDPDN